MRACNIPLAKAGAIAPGILSACPHPDKRPAAPKSPSSSSLIDCLARSPGLFLPPPPCRACQKLSEALTYLL